MQNRRQRCIGLDISQDQSGSIIVSSPMTPNGGGQGDERKFTALITETLNEDSAVTEDEICQWFDFASLSHIRRPLS